MSAKRIKDIFKCLMHPVECSRVKKLLYEFVEGELPKDAQQKLQEHLGDCPGCLKYVETYRHTIELTHKHCLPETPMPDALKDKLREFIAQHPDLK